MAFIGPGPILHLHTHVYHRELGNVTIPYSANHEEWDGLFVALKFLA
jgi:hypothetical protein